APKPEKPAKADKPKQEKPRKEKPRREKAPQPAPAPAPIPEEPHHHKRGVRQGKLSDTLPQQPAMPETDFYKPNPLDSDVIMDATARLLAPRRPVQPPRSEKPQRERKGRKEQPAKQEKPKQEKPRKEQPKQEKQPPKAQEG